MAATQHNVLCDGITRIEKFSIWSHLCNIWSTGILVLFCWLLFVYISDISLPRNLPSIRTDGVKKFSSVTEMFARTQVSRHRNMRRAKTFRTRLRQDETETSFKCLRHETLQDTGSKTRDAKTLRIRLRRDWDAVKIFATETLPRYSYQDTL